MISGKYIGIIGFMVLIVSISGGISDLLDFFSLYNDVNIDINKTSDGAYSVAGVSFKCPDNWNVSAEKQSENDIKISVAPYPKDSNFIPFKTPYMIPLNTAQFVVAITSNNKTPEEVSKPIEHSDINKISNDTLIINGIKVYRQIFTVNYNGTVLKCEQINFVKNNKEYVMTFQAPDNAFDKEKSNFDIILNSFKVD